MNENDKLINTLELDIETIIRNNEQHIRNLFQEGKIDEKEQLRQITYIKSFKDIINNLKTTIQQRSNSNYGFSSETVQRLRALITAIAYCPDHQSRLVLDGIAQELISPSHSLLAS